MAKEKDPETLYCSFCGRPKDRTSRLVVAPGGVYICDACVELCAQVPATVAHECRDSTSANSSPSPNKERIIG